MKKRIKGLMYDTNTAKKVADYDPGYAVSDFKRYTEALYKKRTGEYFLYGEGNADSPYKEFNRAANSWEAGEEIRPLTIDEAKHWVEEHQDEWDKDIYEQEFGEIKASKVVKKQKLFSLSQSAIAKLKRMASVQGVPQSEIVEELIQNS